MASTYWTLSDNQTLAEYVPLDAFTGLLQDRLAISPDHVALLIRDGQIVDAFIGAHFALGGVWQRLKEVLGGPHALRLLVADLKPFQIEGEVEGLAQDGVPVAATVAIEFQVNPEAPANILGLMRERGALTKPDVYQRTFPHLRERVFRTVLIRIPAADIRGNTALQDKMQADVLLEVRRSFQDLGVLVRAVTLTWALNDVERSAMQQSESEREQAMLDYQFQCRKREIEREKEASVFQLRADVDLETLQASSEDEIRHLVLRQELNFIDARQAGVRAQEMKTLAHELDVLSVQRRAGYQKALEDARTDVERAEIQRKLTQLDLEIDAMKQEHRLRFVRLQEEQDLVMAAEARRQQVQSLRDISMLELDGQERGRRIEREDRAADLEMRLKADQQKTQSEIDRLRIQAQMSPDQILAINAGLSPEVARVFSERARVTSIDVDKREALLREMVQLTTQGRMASEEQARFFFDKAMQPTTAPRTTGRPEVEPSDTVECAGCHKKPPRTDRFCRYCGHELRA